jgi:exosome complex component CSL4
MVKARVLSLGDSRSFFLSTADNELGVLLAHSSASNQLMVPISWQQMQCPVTLVKEFRKVAKVASTSTPVVDPSTT